MPLDKPLSDPMLAQISVHYSDARMSAMASQIAGVPIGCSDVCSGADQKKIRAPRHQPLWLESTGDR